MKPLDIAIIFLRVQALMFLLYLLVELTYVPTYFIPSGEDMSRHFLLSRAFFMLDMRILINGLAAYCLWKYALQIRRFVITAMPKTGD